MARPSRPDPHATHARRAAVTLLLVALAVPLAVGSPLGLDTHVAAAEKPGGFGYVLEDVVVDVAGTLTFTNLDLRAHDVVAVAKGPDTNPWCAFYPAGACPLFWSPIIGTGAHTDVRGTTQLTPSAAYAFYCTVHPWMTGTAHAV